MDEHGIKRKYQHGYATIPSDKWAAAFGRSDQLREEMKKEEVKTPPPSLTNIHQGATHK